MFSDEEIHELLMQSRRENPLPSRGFIVVPPRGSSVHLFQEIDQFAEQEGIKDGPEGLREWHRRSTKNNVGFKPDQEQK